MSPSKYNYTPRPGSPIYFDDFITRTSWILTNKLQATRLLPAPATNVFETRDALVIELVAPGLSHHDLKVQFADQALNIHYDSPSPSFEPMGERQQWRNEYGLTTFHRTFGLNQQVLAVEELELSSDQRIIRLEIPKREEYRGQLAPVHPFSMN
jgi:HSP20 family protein